jgi:predicted CXXCH cytochrome family protein
MMKKIFILLLVIAFMVAATAAFATIANTKHNLTSTGGQITRNSDGTATLCGFCHIPHWANTATAGLPLWGRNNPATTNYRVYGSLVVGGFGTTLSGTTVNMPGSLSLVCLSCHDGTISIGTVQKITTQGTFTTNYPMQGNVTATGIFDPTKFTTAYNPVVGAGQDLRNDHPVGLVYRGTLATASGLTNSIDALNNIVGTFPIYGGAVGTGRLECASCHEPHLEGSAGQTKFLRTLNATLCQACHATK